MHFPAGKYVCCATAIHGIWTRQHLCARRKAGRNRTRVFVCSSPTRATTPLLTVGCSLPHQARSGCAKPIFWRGKKFDFYEKYCEKCFRQTQFLLLYWLALLELTLEFVSPAWNSVKFLFLYLKMFPGMAGRGVEERVLVEDVDEVNMALYCLPYKYYKGKLDRAKQTVSTLILLIMTIIVKIILIPIRWTSACASTLREAKQFGARHLFNWNWSKSFIIMMIMIGIIMMMMMKRM